MERLAKNNYRCEATDIPFFETSENGVQIPVVNSHLSPSLDQIIPGAGYTKNNIRIVCRGFNTMKNKYSDQDLIEIFVPFLRKNNYKIKKIS